VTVNCTTVWTGQIAAPLGSDTFTITLYDAQNAAGNLLSTGSLTQTIAQSVANAVNVTLNGVVAALAVVLNPTGVQTGLATSVAVTVNALDADGNTIVGPGSYVTAGGSPLGTITLSDSDTSGATLLSAFTLAAPASGITLAYNGAAIANPTIGASATGVARGSNVLTLNVATSTVYVANETNNTITEYASNANGNIAPTVTIGGSLTSLNSPRAVAVDANGKIYVANTAGNSVTEYAANATGNQAPLATIVGPNTNLDGPQGIAVDKNGLIYVANTYSISLTVYAANTSGNMSPIATISGSNTDLAGLIGVAVDANGIIYATNGTNVVNQAVITFAANSNFNALPTAIISGTNTILSAPIGLALEPNGNIAVANADNNSVTVYGANPSGNLNEGPAVRIAGANTGLSLPTGVAVDASGNIYVSNDGPTPSVTVYSATANGAVPPAATISGGNTGLDAPNGIAVH
jgi:sugar lactone lactonase YvrE